MHELSIWGFFTGNGSERVLELSGWKLLRYDGPLSNFRNMRGWSLCNDIVFEL